MEVRISEVVTDLVVTEGVGSLSPEEVKKIVTLVLDQIKEQQGRTAQRERDTTIHDRAFRPGD